MAYGISLILPNEVVYETAMNAIVLPLFFLSTALFPAGGIDGVLGVIVNLNPFTHIINVILPKSEYKKRDIWDAGMIRTALDQCTDSKLYVAMNLSFACSLRMGEILGLTWSNVHISDEEIAADNAYVYIDKELTRVARIKIVQVKMREFLKSNR